MKVGWLLPLALLAMGCSKSSEGPAGDAGGTTPTKNLSGAATNYESLRAGQTLIEGAADSIESALHACNGQRDKETGELKLALEDVSAMLDSAGATLQEAIFELPAAPEVNKEITKYKALQSAMVSATEDAYMELRDALGAARSLAEATPAINELADLIELAMNDTQEALTELGGKVPSDQAPEGATEVAPD